MIQRVFPHFISGPGAVGLLILRVVVGAAFMFHGWDKVQNPFGWMGPASIMPGILQALAALSEFGGGLALIVGLLTPIAAFGIACTMLVALTTVNFANNHPFVAANAPGKPFKPSYELGLTFLSIMIMLMLVGPGILSRCRHFRQKSQGARRAAQDGWPWHRTVGAVLFGRQ